FLRVVRDPTFAIAICKKGREEWDALDQVTDSPQPHEKIFVYRKVADHGMVHICAGRGRGGYFAHAEYELYQPQPHEDAVRRNEDWQTWAHETYRQLNLPAKEGF
ncbi:MAG TPA: hypothetical protein VNH19_10545, partial [Candidatus Limnocylindrales bacterium]|nr:hypothetical protein [Candidatus Limnocylindrales bacterium]